MLTMLYNKNVKNFAEISFVVRRKDFSTPFDVIMIYTKQRTSLAVDNSEIAEIGVLRELRKAHKLMTHMNYIYIF